MPSRLMALGALGEAMTDDLDYGAHRTNSTIRSVSDLSRG
jgi:hypothetical protein